MSHPFHVINGCRADVQLENQSKRAKKTLFCGVYSGLPPLSIRTNPYLFP